jgi:hypothetical protein
VAELAALEMLCTGNCTVGSNPTLSANRLRISDCGLRILASFNPQSEIRNPQSFIRLRTPCNREAANPARPGTEQR